ncbi:MULTISPECIES: hypothetical protein [unclassified Bradyrhizobium]|uniref:hypothetical protein n=1 Tax=unclassified Bradyrhizobium TaxID=2631580 RepID=UPI002916730B|nr:MULTISPECIES: hypothetical protein [unclassified Bradyrhizobium]
MHERAMRAACVSRTNARGRRQRSKPRCAIGRFMPRAWSLVVPIVKPDAANVVFGRSHFKAVEDLHGAGGAVQGTRFELGDATFRHIACQKKKIFDVPRSI